MELCALLMLMNLNINVLVVGKSSDIVLLHDEMMAMGISMYLYSSIGILS